MKVRSGQRYFCGAKGDYEKRRSWARQSSGMHPEVWRLRLRTLPKDSKYHAKNVSFGAKGDKKMLANSLKAKCTRKETHFKSLKNR